MVSDFITLAGKAIDSIVSNKKEQDALKIRLEELEIQKDIEQKKVLGGILNHKSSFVSGSLTAIIWLLVFSLTANCIVFPFLGAFGLKINPIELPLQYWSLLNVVIAGIFGKEVIDDNEWSFGGKVICPAKSQVAEAVRQGDTTPIANRKAVKDMSDEEFAEYYKDHIEKFNKKAEKAGQ